MQYICKEKFEVNETVVGNKGDVLVITDAAPKANEDLEDVKGYCDIANLTTNQSYESTWMDVDESVLDAIK